MHQLAMYNINIYYGQVPNDDNLVVNHDFGKNSAAIVRLCEPIFDYGYHLFTDRLYSCVDLAEELKLHFIHLTGTVMINRRGTPDAIKTANLTQRRGGCRVGDIRPYRKEDILFVTWKDKRLVNMLSNWYRGNKTIEKNLQGCGDPLTKPIVVESYNQNTGGVDLTDQYNNYYSGKRKSVK